MTAADVTLFSLGIAIMLAGAAGAFIPLIPGLPLNWLVLLGYGFWSDWGPYGFWTMFWSGLAVAAGLVCDQLAGAMGAKKFGASRAGMIGAFVGAIVGVIALNIPGLILGTFFGAMIAEIQFDKKEAKAAADSGLGALLGCLAGGVFKFMISMVLTVAYIWLVLAYTAPAPPSDGRAGREPEGLWTGGGKDLEAGGAGGIELRGFIPGSPRGRGKAHSGQITGKTVPSQGFKP
ncbi:MAG: DUF456 domain-containing protein [Deltaproteobacteria bacterium]|jgi:uncharacterized protein YqgC (DUF456 family)|nr:DUF456 domain-containing protein [Deltaproteobacteria bacterium]